MKGVSDSLACTSELNTFCVEMVVTFEGFFLGTGEDNDLCLCPAI